MYLFTVPGDSVLTHPWIEEASMSVRWTLFYMLFGYWWTCAFLHGLFHTCVSGIVGNWYFEKKQQRSARQAPQPSTRILGVKPCGTRDGIRNGAKGAVRRPNILVLISARAGCGQHVYHDDAMHGQPRHGKLPHRCAPAICLLEKRL